jgi:Ca-activated chloride channel family protein
MKTRFLVILMLLLTAALFAEQILVDVTLSNPVLLDTGRQTNYLRVGLTGFEIEDKGERPPVNAALVIDCSGSMGGEKIRQAKQAGHTAVDMLRDGDVISIIAYSDSAWLVLPATVLTRWNRNQFHNAINRLQAGGSTALFAGVSMGSRELDYYISQNRVNRVILLSDGLANVGPDSPGELGDYGEILKRKGISVTTIGLGNGYNADLMYELAARSDGNHSFVEHPSQLAGIFEKEFESLMAVVAQDVEVRISCGPGIRPIRVINRNGEIYDNDVVINMNQIYSRQEQYVIIEVAVDPGAAGEKRNAAEVSVNYMNMKSKNVDTVNDNVAIAFAKTDNEVKKNMDKKTSADVTLQIATDRNEEALKLRDEGQIEEAEQMLNENALFLEESATELDSEELLDYATQNYKDAEGVTSDDWEKEKKSMRETQNKNRSQQIY